MKVDEIKRKNKKRERLIKKEKEELLQNLHKIENREYKIIRKKIESSKCINCEWAKDYGNKIFCMMPRCIKK